jgi:alkylation response protein AidB-like acyl-CoA dehydrogenase
MCERSTPTQRISLGFARAAVDDAFGYARQGEAFSGKIIDFQASSGASRRRPQRPTAPG